MTPATIRLDPVWVICKIIRSPSPWVIGLTVWVWTPWLVIPALVLAGGLTALALRRTRRERDSEPFGLTPTSTISMDWLRSLAAKEPGVAERLEELDQLHRDGAITEAEYEAKRRGIVGGL